MPTTVKPAASMLEGKSQQGQEQHRHKGTSPGLPGKATFSEQGFSRAEPQVSRPDQEPEPSSHPPLKRPGRSKALGLAGVLTFRHPKEGWKGVNWRCRNSSSVQHSLGCASDRGPSELPRSEKLRCLWCCSAQPRPPPTPDSPRAAGNPSPVGTTSSQSVQLSHHTVPGKIQGKSSSIAAFSCCGPTSHQHRVRHSRRIPGNPTGNSLLFLLALLPFLLLEAPSKKSMRPGHPELPHSDIPSELTSRRGHSRCS